MLTSDVQQEKKSRHSSGSSLSDIDEAREEQDMQQQSAFPPDLNLDGTSHVHVLSQPLNPPDIYQIAIELRSMMLPDIKSVVKDAVTEAFSSLQDAVRDLRFENERLRKDYDELEKRVVQSENENDELNQYGRRNILRIFGIPEKNDEVTDDIVLKLAGDLNVELTKYDIDRSHRVGKHY